MDIKNKYIGDLVYINKLARNVVVCEENKHLFVNLKWLFNYKKAVKNDSVKPISDKPSKPRTKRKSK